MTTRGWLFLALWAACSPHARSSGKPTQIPVAAGDGPESRAPPKPPPAPSPPKLQVALGNSSACVRVRGSLYCWERGSPPKLPLSKQAEAVRGLTDVTDVGLGYSHVCAIAARGRVFCWGNNERGQLGAGLADANRSEPVRVQGIEDARALAVGSWHTCALLADGHVSCWGWNSSGQTGGDVEYGPAARELVLPEPVTGLARVTALSAGRDQTCAFAGGAWTCFGRSYFESQRAARGDGHNEPAPVPELSSLLALSLREESACGIFKGGGVSCWGSGAFSLVRNRAVGGDRAEPVAVTDAVQIAVGSYHACAVSKRGRVSCWGIDVNGRLGRGRAIEGYEPNGPEEIPGLSGVTALALDALGTCAVTVTDEIWCWGHVPQLAYDAQRPVVSPERIPLE